MTDVRLGSTPLTLADSPLMRSAKISGVPAIISRTFRGHGANVSGGTLISRGVASGEYYRTGRTGLISDLFTLSTVQSLIIYVDLHFKLGRRGSRWSVI